ncbi:CPBP family glutamic-type intramembrane protease [Erythrobacter donghaensis]|uniref:CPBP family glutamic-type intramembrane protease n=1 Tax=Erythrobacter donghaensis TaxID=267135 RepID=UPI00130273CE|nr:CPBP family glutamic-type intramembrane protease [Erythrobacter donghaensis]
MTLGERLADIGQFAVRPTYAPRSMAWGGPAAAALLVLLALDLTVGLAAVKALALLGNTATGGPMPTLVESDSTLAVQWMEALLLAPVLEELLFRGWLTGRIATLKLAAWGMAAMALLIVSESLPDQYGGPLSKGTVTGMIIALIQWRRTRHSEASVPEWFVRHFHWIVWGSTLLFGAIHFGNFETLTHPLGLLVVLPQTIGGLLLAYTRTRLGLRAAIAHHFAFNAVWMAAQSAGW